MNIKDILLTCLQKINNTIVLRCYPWGVCDSSKKYWKSSRTYRT